MPKANMANVNDCNRKANRQATPIYDALMNAQREFKVSRNFVVYASRNRLTGTLTRTLDTRHPDSDVKFNVKKGRYIAECVEHKTRVFFAEHYHAGRAIAHVDEWCNKCKAMIAAGKKVVNKRDMSAPPNETKQDARMRINNNAADKRWRNGNTRRNAATETQRKADTTTDDGADANGGMIVNGNRRSNKRTNLATKRNANAARKPSEVVTIPASESEAEAVTE